MINRLSWAAWETIHSKSSVAGLYVVFTITLSVGIPILNIDILNKLGVTLIIMFSIGLVAGCTKSPEAIGSLKTAEGNLVRNHIFRDGSLGRTLICPANENHKAQILINSKFESTSCEEEVSNICDPFVTEVLDFDLDLSTKTETYYVRCK